MKRVYGFLSNIGVRFKKIFQVSGLDTTSKRKEN